MEVFMKCFLYLLFCFFLISKTFGQIHLSGSLSGVLEGDTTYIVDDDDIWVEENDSLIIEPGAVLKFALDKEFTIYGYLYSVGTEIDSIIYMVSAGFTSWNGICFSLSANDSSKLGYCIITRSISSGIFCNYSSPMIYNCSISENFANYGAGINLYNSNSRIINCNIYRNHVPLGNTNSGGGILINHSSPFIENCNIINNRANIGAGVYFYYSSDVFMLDCSIIDNFALDGGGIFHYQSDNIIIDNCIIKGNIATGDGGGINSYQNPFLNLLNCLLTENTAYAGGAVFCHMTHQNIFNCTISQNTATYGSAIHCCANYPVSIINSIFEGNTGSACIYFNNAPLTIISFSDFFNNPIANFFGSGPDSLELIVQTNANGDSCDYFYNIYLDPLFVDAQAGDFNLLWGSPSIDAGDPASPLDPDSTIADMGAYYFDQSVTAPVVEDLTITVEGDNILLHWSPFTIATSYNIYRSTDPYFDITGMTPVASVTEPEHVEEGAVNEGRWFYVVTMNVE